MVYRDGASRIAQLADRKACDANTQALRATAEPAFPAPLRGPWVLPGTMLRS